MSNAEINSLNVDECYLSGEQFDDLFKNINLPNLADADIHYELTDDKQFNQQIINHAQALGYILRPIVDKIADLKAVNEEVDKCYVQSLALTSWRKMRQAAKDDGYDIKIISAYRNRHRQKEIFFESYNQDHNWDNLKARMKQVAPPGYSKHQTGYAIDIAAGMTDKEPRGIHRFADSQAYQWMSANNYSNAKKYGWIPSYPPDGGRQGPEPEPWEFVYVGIDNLCRYQQAM